MRLTLRHFNDENDVINCVKCLNRSKTTPSIDKDRRERKCAKRARDCGFQCDGAMKYPGHIAPALANEIVPGEAAKTA